VAEPPPPGRRFADLDGTLEEHRAGAISAEVAAARLVLAGHRPAPLADRLARTPGGEPVAGVLRAHPDGAERLALAARALRADAPPGDGVEQQRCVYERLAAIDPAIAVAAYSFGDAALLDRATEELVGLLRRWDLLGPGASVVDVGCGIGRLAARIAPRAGRVLGLDLSPAMLAEARARCGHLPGVRFELADGRSLRPAEDGSADLVLAVDTMPSARMAGADAAEALQAAMARALAPGGRILVMNYSYGGDPEADRRHVRAWARACGLRVLRDGTRDLSLWDGRAYLLADPRGT
jgi:SAM-dependent methyltransferase